MKKIILLWLILWASFVWAEKIATFKELAKPEKIVVGDNRLYINEAITVYIYSLKDFKLIKKFGKAGEGPQEFKYDVTGLGINLLPDSMMIQSICKLSLYSKDGDFIKEQRISPLVWRVKPVGDRFFITTNAGNKKANYNILKILDHEFKDIKTIYNAEVQHKKEGQATNYANTWDYDSCDNKFFIAGRTGFIIEAFDFNGKHLFSIKPGYERVKVTDTFINGWFNRIKRRHGMVGYHRAKQRVRFPEYFPAVLDLVAQNGKIYVLTYRRENDKNECLIFDSNGKFLQKLFLPLLKRDPVVLYPYAIDNEKLYQLVENEDTEEWELHMTEIK